MATHLSVRTELTKEFQTDSMVKQPNTSKGKQSYDETNIDQYRGIWNYVYYDGKETHVRKISATPEEAFWNKNGKDNKASDPNWTQYVDKK